MSEPSVDIGISVYRRGDFIAELIESVLAQSYHHWRLTIAEDDGPTEAVTRAVAPYLADERIEYHAEPDHLGLPRMKARLIERGAAKYVAIPDDDDLWLPDWLERRVTFLESHDECVLAWGGHLDIDVHGVELGRSPFPFAGGAVSSREFVQSLRRRNFVTVMSVLFRRDAYMRAGGEVDKRLIHAWDWELWLRLAMFGPVGFLPVHDSCYRAHPAQMSRSHDRAMDQLLLLERLDSLLAVHHPDLRLPAAIYRRRKADKLLAVALDAVEAGDPRRGAANVASAARLAPGALASARGAAAIAAIAGGRRVRQRIGALRS
jgi:glycosyltransferase involved in cell wall biosynthesis